MAINRGKEFEEVVKQAFEKVPNTSIDRIHDQTNGFRGSKNICDFIVYHYPNQYYIECKTVHGNILPFSNITDRQWQGLLEKSKIKGVIAGVICWWVDKDTTLFLPIELLNWLRNDCRKSIRYDAVSTVIYKLTGKKKRIFYEYDMREFFNEVGNEIQIKQ